MGNIYTAKKSVNLLTVTNVSTLWPLPSENERYFWAWRQISFQTNYYFYFNNLYQQSFLHGIFDSVRYPINRREDLIISLIATKYKKKNIYERLWLLFCSNKLLNWRWVFS